MEGESDEIAFSNVSFSYEAKKKVLEGISFRAGHGLTALVGESGCGKSTTTLLLMGDRRADEGQIFIGDMPIDKMDLKALRRKITRIRHDSYLFAGTIRENLLMGKEDATETQMKEALREVNLLDFVEKSGGLDFVLLEKASNLSGGQKQRLSLARALLHDTPIYIFDEATSNVDVESENDIMAVVRKTGKNKNSSFDLTQTCECCVCGSDICAKRRNDCGKRTARSALQRRWILSQIIQTAERIGAIWKGGGCQ